MTMCTSKRYRSFSRIPRSCFYTPTSLLLTVTEKRSKMAFRNNKGLSLSDQVDSALFWAALIIIVPYYAILVYLYPCTDCLFLPLVDSHSTKVAPIQGMP